MTPTATETASLDTGEIPEQQEVLHSKPSVLILIEELKSSALLSPLQSLEKSPSLLLSTTTKLSSDQNEAVNNVADIPEKDELIKKEEERNMITMAGLISVGTLSDSPGVVVRFMQRWPWMLQRYCLQSQASEGFVVVTA
ncbi:hypothetical protein YC2023_016158 [Brassica napus]